MFWLFWDSVSEILQTWPQQWPSPAYLVRKVQQPDKFATIYGKRRRIQIIFTQKNKTPLSFFKTYRMKQFLPCTCAVFSFECVLYFASICSPLTANRPDLTKFGKWLSVHINFCFLCKYFWCTAVLEKLVFRWIAPLLALRKQSIFLNLYTYFSIYFSIYFNLYFYI